jgi:hypothetical protein
MALILGPAPVVPTTHFFALSAESGSAFGVTPDGGAVGGNVNNPSTGWSDAFCWTVAGGLVRLPSLDGAGGSVFGGVGGGVGDQTIVGGSGSDGTGNVPHPVLWTPSGGLVDLGLLGGMVDGLATGCSSNGGSVAGGMTDGATSGKGFYWTLSGGLVDMGTVGSRSQVTPVAVSGDGSAVIGDAYNGDALTGGDATAWIWTPGGGMVEIGIPGGKSYSHALAVSGDGLVVVGYAGNTVLDDEAWVWSAGTGLVLLGNLGGGMTASYLLSVDAAGRTATGYSTDGGVSGGIQHACIWTSSNGSSLTDLGVISGGLAETTGSATSGDGVFSAGDLSDGAFSGGTFRWDAGGGLRPLMEEGVPTGMTTSHFNSLAASDDGSVLAGAGVINGVFSPIIWTANTTYPIV